MVTSVSPWLGACLPRLKVCRDPGASEGSRAWIALTTPAGELHDPQTEPGAGPGPVLTRSFEESISDLIISLNESGDL